jgi:hypothetical protein
MSITKRGLLTFGFVIIAVALLGGATDTLRLAQFSRTSAVRRSCYDPNDYCAGDYCEAFVSENRRYGLCN